MRKIVHVDDFSRELITNLDTGDAPLNSATKFENIRGDKPGLMRGIPGYLKFADGPSGIAGDVRWFREVVLNDTQVLICWGLDGNSIQHFYYSVDGGSNWVEITEIYFFLVGATITGDDQFYIKAGSSPFDDTPSGTNDTYNQMFLFAFDVTGSAEDYGYIIDYDGTNKDVTLNNNLVFTPAENDKIVIMRFPLWGRNDLVDLALGTLSDFDDERNFVKDDANFKPSLVQRQEAVAILTGQIPDNVSERLESFSNFWFGYVATGNLFDDADLAYTGYHAQKRYLKPYLVNASTITTGVTGASSDPLDADDYAVIVTFIYDGYQEGDQILYNQLTVLNDIAAAQVQTVASGEELDVTLVVLKSHNSQLLYPQVDSFRRITGMRIYLAQVDTIGTNYEATTPFFLVKEIDTNSATWNYSSGYKYAVTINGRDWNAGQRNELQSNRGHFSRLWVNADFGINVNGVEIVAGLLIGEQGGDREPSSFDQNSAYIIPSAINSALRNTPDATAVSDIINMGENGIYEIKAITNIFERLAVFGENKLQIMIFSQGKLVPYESHEEKGINGHWAYHSTGQELRWGNFNSIYQISGTGDPVEIGFPIKDTWQALSAANRQNALGGYDKLNDLFLLQLKNDGTMYIFDTKRTTWRNYESDKTWEWLTEGVDGEVLATDKTDIYTLLPDPSQTQTESLTATYEKDFDFDGYVDFKKISLGYKSPVVVTVTIYDLEKGTNYPATNPVKFFPKTNFDNEVKKVSFRAKKIRVRIQVAATTDPTWGIDWYSLYGEPESRDK